jgi:hypothetical protein
MSRIAPPRQLQLDGGILVAAKRPRFEMSLPIFAEDEAINAPTVDKVTNASSNNKVAATRTDTATKAATLLCMGGSRTSARKWKTTGGAKLMEAVNTWGNNGVAVASMMPGQSQNALCAIWAKVHDSGSIACAMSSTI